MSKKNQYQINREIEEFIKAKDKKKETYSTSDIDFIQQRIPDMTLVG